MLIVDSREKWTQSDKAELQNLKRYFDRHEIPYTVQKLDYGDYTLAEDRSLVIDRKQNLNEVCTNLITRDKGRFWNEIRKAHEQGIKLVVLIEHGGKIRNLRDVAMYQPKYTRVSGKRLLEEMYKVHIAYGVEWAFCSKQSTGKRIIEILTTEREKWMTSP